MGSSHLSQGVNLSAFGRGKLVSTDRIRLLGLFSTLPDTAEFAPDHPPNPALKHLEIDWLYESTPYARSLASLDLGHRESFPFKSFGYRLNALTSETSPPESRHTNTIDSLGSNCVKKPIQILFIEDSPGDALLVLQIAAPFSSVNISMACDGEQALAILSDPEFDAALVILDLNLPKISGYSVLERNPRKDIPVVVFTVSSNPTDVQRALDLGAREYFLKPMDMEAYKEAVSWMIEKWAVPTEDEVNGATATS